MKTKRMATQHQPPEYSATSSVCTAQLAKSTLECWLRALKDGEPGTIDFHFPTDAVRNEYLATIEQRDWESIVSLLRRFLLPSCSLGCDLMLVRSIAEHMRATRKTLQHEFSRRLLRYAATKKRRPQAPPPWEGVTWILDLLPDRPRAAIRVLDAYFEAHCLFLPDGRMHGIFDAMAIIRARCIERPRSEREALELLHNEPPRTLECLVERLYNAMGYETTLTPRQNDGGYDVRAKKRQGTRRIDAHIECKRWRERVSVPILRSLLGAVSDNKATNGICVTTSDLTKPAKTFVDKNPRLDFVPGALLLRSFNEHLGPNWFFNIDRLTSDAKQSAVASNLAGQGLN